MSDNYLKDLFIDEVKGALKGGESSGGGGDTSALEATMNQKFTEVNAKIDGIQIGGRNLVYGSSTELTASSPGGTKSLTVNSEYFLQSIDRPITFSVYVEAENAVPNTSASHRCGIEVTASKDSVATRYYNAFMQFGEYTESNPLNFSGRISQTILPTSGLQVSAISDLKMIVNGLGSGTIKLSNPKIEIGNKATDWTSAPEDLDAAISGLDTRLTANEANLSSVSAVAHTAKSSAVTARTTAEEALESADQAVSLIGGMEIGGSNLLLNSELIQMSNYDGSVVEPYLLETVSEWGTTDALYVTGTGGTSTVFGVLRNQHENDTIYLSDKKYVMSIYVKNDGENELFVSLNDLSSTVMIAPGEVKRVVCQGVGNGTYSMAINFSTATAGEAFSLTYWHPKIEFGTIPTDWSPAPEDILEKIDATNTELDQLKTDLGFPIE